MQQRCTEDNAILDRYKSRSTLSLLWDGPNDLQKFMDTCFNSHKIIDIDIDDPVEPHLNSVLSKSHLKDSGTSSLNDEDQLFIFEKDGLIQTRTQTVKHIVQKFSQCANGYFNSEIEREKWHLVIQEIVETEHIYLRSLMEVEEGYLKMSNSLFMGDKEVALIFSNWKDLREFHSVFLEKLKLINPYDFSGLYRLSECFIEEIEQFENLYSEYCTNYTQSVKHLHHMETTSSYTWQSLIKCQIQLGHQLPLSTFLLKPVQRILRYHLLLKELIQCCKLMQHQNADEIVESLLKALDSMLQVANRINERQIEREDQLRRLKLIDELYESALFNCPILGKPFLDGELKVPGCKNSRLTLLCENALVLAKRLGNGKWDIRQVIKCKEMMLFEYIPKQPLEFHVVDTTDNKNKVTLQVINAQEKEMWCKMIKELIISSYEHDSISERAKRILLDNKHNVLAQCSPISNQVLEKFHITLNREDDMLDLESSLRKMFDPVPTQHSQNKYKNIKRRNSVGAIKSESKTNYRDPSIYQWSARKHCVNDDIDCRSIMIDVNEENFYSHNGQPFSHQEQAYEPFIQKSRNKTRLTTNDIKEIFQPLKQMHENSDNSSVLLGEMELASLCSDADLDSVASDSTNSNNVHKLKTTSMDRNYGISLCTKANSFNSSIDTNSSTSKEFNNNNSHRKKVLFSSVRESKTTRSNSDWGSLFETDQKPGIVKRFFKASAKLTKRDKNKPEMCSIDNENNNKAASIDEHYSFKSSTSNCDIRRKINKSNSIDYIGKPHSLIQKSNSGRKKTIPPTPCLLENIKTKNDEDQIESKIDDSYPPIKPPRQLPQFKIEMFDKMKSASSDRIKTNTSSQTKSLNNNELSNNTNNNNNLANSESATLSRVKDMVSLFQSDR